MNPIITLVYTASEDNLIYYTEYGLQIPTLNNYDIDWLFDSIIKFIDVNTRTVNEETGYMIKIKTTNNAKTVYFANRDDFYTFGYKIYMYIYEFDMIREFSVKLPKNRKFDFIEDRRTWTHFPAPI